jgi:DNA-binding NarL/FixJ family response regulator
MVLKPLGRHVRILIAQDHPLLASEIAAVLGGEDDFEVATISSSGAAAVRDAVIDRPDVVLMDYRLPDISGPAAAGLILEAHPTTAIVFHSADESETALLDAVDAGAIGYLTKEAGSTDILEAVRRAAQGEVLIPVELFARAIARQRSVAASSQLRQRRLSMFTPRELDVLRLLALGMSTDEMGKQLGIAPHTVRWHVEHVIEKLQVHSKLQAVIAAARQGIIEL